MRRPLATQKSASDKHLEGFPLPISRMHQPAPREEILELPTLTFWQRDQRPVGIEHLPQSRDGNMQSEGDLETVLLTPISLAMRIGSNKTDLRAHANYHHNRKGCRDHWHRL